MLPLGVFSVTDSDFKLVVCSVTNFLFAKACMNVDNYFKFRLACSLESKLLSSCTTFSPVIEVNGACFKPEAILSLKFSRRVGN